MHKIYELKEKLMNELEDYSQNGKYSKDDVEAIKYITSSIDHICNILERADEEEYSFAMEGGRGGNRGGGSYAYARGRGSNAKRDSRGRYSNEGGYSRNDEMMMRLREMMNDAPDETTRQEFKRFMNKLEMM